ncbi:hypothetical protein ACFY94_26005 [Streptomyces griseorubiginosus]|uniref:hypothetical protein n=1 Tax=Streptomyces griseorubiginosus TaxID=67304 RepID=UPI0036E0FD1F
MAAGRRLTGWQIGGLTGQEVRRERLADPAAAPYTSEITLCPAWGKVTRIARELL